VKKLLSICLLLFVVPVSNVSAQTCNGLPATLIGSENDDDLTGTGGADVIVGLGGNDRIDGSGGDDIICGGNGDDDLLGNDGNDELFGDSGNDVMEGGAGDDSCDGTTGIDSAGIDCETRINMDTNVVRVTLFADDGTQLDGALYIPTGDAISQGTRQLAMIVSHGAMGSYAFSVPKIMGLQAAPLGFPVLALNRRDWGSDGGGGGVLFPETTLDIGPGIDLLETLGYTAVYVAGHSQGTQNAAIYPPLAMDDRVVGVGLYGTVDDGTKTATELLFQMTYDQDVVRAFELMTSARGNEIVAWPTIFGEDLHRSAANWLSFWGPNTLSVVEREIANLEVPALLMRADGDDFTPDQMSLNVLAAANVADVDATYVVLDYPFPLTDFGGNAHGFVGVEREMMQATLDWLTDKVPEATSLTTETRVATQTPPGNLVPIADAGDEQTAVEGWVVTLDSSQSIDLDGDIVSTNWRQVAGDPVSIAGADQVQAMVTVPVLLGSQQTFGFEVTVTDDDGGSDSARVEVLALEEGFITGNGGSNTLALPILIMLFGFGIRRRWVTRRVRCGPESVD
jgi:pimeloyl-ACP methyl ester carboxylesterase